MGYTIRKLLITLSGAREEILQQCPTERVKFQSLGWAIIITSSIAVVSMWFAIASVLGLNPALAFLVGLLWGLVIMGIDRWLVTSMPTDGSRKWTIAIPRVILAVLLGTLISTPLVLRIFQSEINTEITVIRQQQASKFLTEQQNSAVHQQVAYWTKQVSNLEKIINSKGAATINPSDDPQVQALTKQRANELTLEQKYYQQWQCQLYGGAGCTVKGNGPLARASQKSYQQAVDEVNSLTNQIQQRDDQLQQQSRESDQNRYQQAHDALPAARSQLNTATAQENTLRDNFEAENNDTNGLLIRLKALDQLTSTNGTLNGARLLLFLFFLTIECLPVTVKLLQKPGNYEKILRETSRAELRDAQRALRFPSRGRPVPGAGSDGQTRVMYDSREPREMLLDEVWRPRDRTADVPTWVRSAETVRYQRSGQSDEQSQFDEVLRGIVDAEADGHHGGVELRYRDDDS